MDDDGRHTDDISQSWGADDGGAWEPAHLRRPEQQDTGARPSARLQALECDVHALVETVERVEILVDERLSRLEQQLAEVTAMLASSAPRPRRLTGVIKSTRSQ